MQSQKYMLCCNSKNDFHKGIFYSKKVNFIIHQEPSHYRVPSNLAVVFFDILSLNTNRIEAMILRLLHTISLMAFVTTSNKAFLATTVL